MSYELRQDETVGDGIQRIICEQIQAAIRASSAKQNGEDSPVHDTRRHLKRARSALRFAVEEIDPDPWKREDGRLRKIAQLISDVRDAEVRLETVRQLRQFARGKKPTFRETEELLAFELDSFLAAFSEWPQEAKQDLTKTLDCVRSWRLTGLKCKQLRKCVQKTYKRGRKALGRARQKTSIKKLHTFRKRAKELWCQLRILRPLAPELFCELNDELRLLGKSLGQIHDLAFVAERLSSIVSGPKSGDRILNALIESRKKELEVAAIGLGERFYAERPREFGQRIARYFSRWELRKTDCQPATNRLVTATL